MSEHTTGRFDLGTPLTRASTVCSALATTALALLMLSTVADVVRRAVTGQSIPGVIEVAPLILLAAVSLGLVGAETSGTHVRTSIATDRLGARTRTVVRSIGYAVCVAFLAWLTVVTVERAVQAFVYADTTAGFNSFATWPSRALVPVGFGLWGLAMLARLLTELRSLPTDDDEVPS